MCLQNSAEYQVGSYLADTAAAPSDKEEDEKRDGNQTSKHE
jgi:hypothetical protein